MSGSRNSEVENWNDKGSNVKKSDGEKWDVRKLVDKNLVVKLY